MLLSKNRKSTLLEKGYTLVETLIVMGITGTLFISAIAFIQGQQGKTEFNTGVREIEAQVIDVLNDLNTGNYPDFGNAKCNIVDNAPKVQASSGAGVGTNKDCIFLGKVIQFAPKGTSNKGINIYTVVGCRLVSSETALNPTCVSTGNFEVRKLEDAKPTVANDSSKDFTERITSKWNILINKAYVSGAGDTNASSKYGAGLALFYSSLGSNVNSSGSSFGKQEIRWAPIPANTTITTFGVDTSEDSAVSLIKGLKTEDMTNDIAPNELHLCLKGANGGRAKLVIYGENDTRPQTRLEFNPAVEANVNTGGCPA